ncbi:MAG TPA: magnesium/cobalt efflux protein [Gammaproteobacteria bacterium]|nr:magnesium/cobalt efflux protein [Gammaproteobacteria bacterium]
MRSKFLRSKQLRLLLNWWRRARSIFTAGPIDRQYLIEQLEEAESKHLIDIGTVAMMEGALLVSELKVGDIMVARSQMTFVDENARPTDILPEIIESGHSRFPVLDEKREKVLGILLAKDLLSLAIDPQQQFDIKDIIRPAVFVPESKRLNILLREFRTSRNHLAIVIDEYGEIDGLISIEDVIEQIVGEIDDEHDIEDEELIRKHQGNRFTVKSHTPIEEFNEFFGSDLDEQSYDTIGGIVTSAFSYVPRRGEKIEINEYEFKILRADRRRIRLMRVIKISDGVETG